MNYITYIDGNNFIVPISEYKTCTKEQFILLLKQNKINKKCISEIINLIELLYLRPYIDVDYYTENNTTITKEEVLKNAIICVCKLFDISETDIHIQEDNRPSKISYRFIINKKENWKIVL